MDRLTSELLGTMLLVLLGDGVVANVVLRGTKGHQAGWIVITAGWGAAVYVAVACTERFSGAHLNPAVTLGLAAAGRFAWQDVAGYMGAQLLGAMLGATLMYLVYRPHFAASDNADDKLATFCTAPAIREWPANLLSEIMGTFVLVLAVLLFSTPELLPTLLYSATSSTSEMGGTATRIGLGAIGALPVGLLVFSIGLSLGGTTGYAINPARDLGPRIVHALLPIPGKGTSDWAYAPIPVAGPLIGGLLAVLLVRLVGA